MQEEEAGFYDVLSSIWCRKISWSRHQKCKRRRRFLVMSISQFQNNKAWCHEMSWHQRLQEVSLYQFILMFMFISLTSKSILQSSTELARIGCIYMCIVVLCTSHCVVFYIMYLLSWVRSLGRCF